ncbi:MAG: CPBP family intramembrane metalloprotease [Planctomycetaceae bacterium]|nr:CPBP family intramembrane metalloprotease [Planctomycetaceae bacterium]
MYVLLSSVVWKGMFNSVGGKRFSVDYFWFDFFVGEGKLVLAFVLFGVVPILIVKFVFREKLSDYGVRVGEVVRTVRSFCIAFPLVVVIALISGGSGLFCEVYPFNVGLRRGNLSGGLGYEVFLVHAVLYAGYYWGWEFMFRGFMQHGLSEKCGIGVAIFVQTIPSVMLHFGHPSGEVFGAICAGLVWGYLAYRSRSLLSGFAQHTTLGVVLDWKLIYG